MTDGANAPAGNGNTATSKPAWQEAGFGSEAEAIEAAKSVSVLRGEIEAKEAELEKERNAKNKTNTDYMRQAKEIGDLRKKLKEMEGNSGNQNEPPAAPAEITDDEAQAVIDSMDDDEAAKLDKVLDTPENAGLKKQVVAGSKKAMAEFIRAYRENAPPDTTVSVFTALRRTKKEQVPVSSIAKMVKTMLHKENENEKNSLAAVPPTGAPADRAGTKKKPNVFGGVTVDFFKKQQ